MSKSLSPEEFKERLEKENSVLIDVRTKDEFDSEKIKNAKHFPLFLVPIKYEEIKKMKEEGKDVLLYCHSGGRSGQARLWLEAKGIDVDDLRGGIMNWPYGTEK